MNLQNKIPDSKITSALAAPKAGEFWTVYNKVNSEICLFAVISGDYKISAGNISKKTMVFYFVSGDTNFVSRDTTFVSGDTKFVSSDTTNVSRDTNFVSRDTKNVSTSYILFTKTLKGFLRDQYLAILQQTK